MESGDLFLVEQVKLGSKMAFEKLFSKYASGVRQQLISRNKIRQDCAEDFVLESFLEVYDLIQEGKYEEKGLFFSYVYKLAHRKFLKENRCNKDLFTDCEIRDIEEDSEEDNYLLAAEKALEELSEICRDLIYYKNYHKINDQEILEYIPELKCLSNVKNRRNKCMMRLRENALYNLKSTLV